MLTKPIHGWSEFTLCEEHVFSLSYLNDIGFEWLEQAIHGLETMKPFCLQGFMEPGRFLCLVSYWNCHVLLEDDENRPMSGGYREIIHINMIDVCKALYEDFASARLEWANFTRADEEIDPDAVMRFDKLLARFKELIEEREKGFEDTYFF